MTWVSSFHKRNPMAAGRSTSIQSVPSETTPLAQRYILESQIAAGGMAEVWGARDEVLARPVAVKILHPHLSEDEEFRERFKHEALAAARLSHPNIVAVYDTGSERSPEGLERNYIVMEHCGGATLADLLARHGTLEPQRVASIGATICGALSYAHVAGIVHRDIKPANVLVTPEGSLKVADFGIAKAAFAHGDLTTTGSLLGTVTYLSPEQVEGEEPDARSDLYSVGIVLFELLAGRPPFSGDSQIAVAMKHAREPAPKLGSIRAGIPRDLEAIVAQALAKDPDDRYASADEMRAALETAGPGYDASEATVALERPPIPGPTGAAATPRRRAETLRQARSLLPVVGLLALAVLAVVFVPRLFDDADGGTGRPGRDDPTGGGGTGIIAVRAVDDFDPYGDTQEEHSEEAALAADGQDTTSWTTESYTSSLESLGKPGVGLVFDLGRPQAVDRVTVTGSGGYSFELRTGDGPGSTEETFTLVNEVDAARSRQAVDAAGAEGRYWLVWITSLSDDGGGSATLSEVEFRGP